MSTVHLQYNVPDHQHIVSNNIHAISPDFRHGGNDIRSQLHNIAHAYPSKFTETIPHEPLQISSYTPHEYTIGAQENRHRHYLAGMPIYNQVNSLIANHLVNTIPESQILNDYLQEYPERGKQFASAIQNVPDKENINYYLNMLLNTAYHRFIHNHIDNYYATLMNPINKRPPHTYMVTPRFFTESARTLPINDNMLKAYFHHILNHLDTYEHDPRSSEDLPNRVYGYTNGTTVW